jgi:hypothetical protein
VKHIVINMVHTELFLNEIACLLSYALSLQ